MNFISTRNGDKGVTYREATLKGLALDRGLYVPSSIPPLEICERSSLAVMENEEIAFNIINPFVEDDIDHDSLNTIIREAFNFNIPLNQITEDIYSLELFHGPTLSFKDVGARFLARCVSHFNKSSELLNVLVATSGDTGSAVGNGFWKMPGIRVLILYPKNAISEFQESQMTGLGENVMALEVEGNFDDCQQLVKRAFTDVYLNSKTRLTSANSINIARWLAQVVYYFLAIKQYPDDRDLVISVPTGNLGNLTAGLLAKRMGLPVRKFVSATNSNRVVTDYISTGKYKARTSIRTISNAMDVGAPSNFERLMYLYKNDHKQIIRDIESYSFTDNDTLAAIRDVHDDNGYLLDPHGAVSYLALKQALELPSNKNCAGIFLETAHPRKFEDPVRQAIPDILFPDQNHSEGQKISMKNDFKAFSNLLLTTYD